MVAFTDDTVAPPLYDVHLTVRAFALEQGEVYLTLPPYCCQTSSPAWSPDGLRLAVVHQGWEAGIWLAGPLASVQEATRLVADPGASRPSWSRDGAVIAYVNGLGELTLVSSRGSPPTSLGIQGGAPSWGPDGSIVFDRSGDLWIVDPTSQGTIQLTADPYRDVTPAWSPSGPWIVFVSDRSGFSDLWVINANGGNPIQLTFDAADEKDPDWSGDGTKIVFMSTRRGSTDFYAITDLPDFGTLVEPVSWTAVKSRFR